VITKIACRVETRAPALLFHGQAIFRDRSHSFCSTTPERKERLFVANYFSFHALFSEALTRHQGLPRWEEMQAKRTG